MTMTRTFERSDPALIAAIAAFSPATLHEAMGQKGAMAFAIKPLYPGMLVCGPAFTVSCGPSDNLMIHAALTRARPGDVLVVDFKGMTGVGPWGDILTTAALSRGIAGLVIDGCVRDARSIQEMAFPVFARGTNLKGTTKMLPGDLDVPIVCGSVLVNPGDIVVGDDDGVVVVPKAEAAAVLDRARERERREEDIRRQIRAGRTTVELFRLEAHLRAAGLEAKLED